MRNAYCLGAATGALAAGLALSLGAGAAHAQSQPKRCFDKGTLKYYDCPTEKPAPVVQNEPAPQRPAPVVDHGPNWSGPYVGIHGGYAWGGMDGTYSGLSGSYDVDEVGPEGWLAGGQLGYLHQFDNNFTLGGEVDFSWAWADQDFANGADSLSAELDWLSTARIRAGYAAGWAMPYITGGVALASYEFNGSSPGFGASTDETAWGGVAGGGVDFMLSDNVVLRTEGLYYFFDDEQDISGSTGTPGDTAGLGDVGVARAAVSFKF